MRFNGLYTQEMIIQALIWEKEFPIVAWKVTGRHRGLLRTESKTATSFIRGSFEIISFLAEGAVVL